MLLTSETTVKDFMLEKDVVYTEIRGVCRNFQVVGDPVYMSDGSIELTVEMLLGNSAKAVEKFEECLKLHPADLYSLIEIATIYEKKQDHPKIIETYDRLYDLNPELIPQSGMQKIYKKACKKTRTQGKYLDRF